MVAGVEWELNRAVTEGEWDRSVTGSFGAADWIFYPLLVKIHFNDIAFVPVGGAYLKEACSLFHLLQRKKIDQGIRHTGRTHFSQLFPLVLFELPYLISKISAFILHRPFDAPAFLVGIRS